MHLAYDRYLAGDDLSFAEILFALYPCRPKRIGCVALQELSFGEALEACRFQEYEDFDFENPAEQDQFRRNRHSAREAAADLVGRGLLAEVQKQRLIWNEDEPTVKRIEPYTTLRLTEKGREMIPEKRRHPRVPLVSPVVLYPDAGPGQPGFLKNISRQGLSTDLFRKYDIGQNFRLRFLAFGNMEIFARVVWMAFPFGKGEVYGPE
ncbi:MAG TPA: PilZ domain-containing protein [Thermodesulfobacteriota bacterium]|nr:PilZ domain-containing protein [Thermodesulfobacteriota bacterium]